MHFGTFNLPVQTDTNTNVTRWHSCFTPPLMTDWNVSFLLGELVSLVGLKMRKCSEEVLRCPSVKRHLFAHIPRETNWTFSIIYTWGLGMSHVCCVWVNINEKATTSHSYHCASHLTAREITSRTFNITKIESFCICSFFQSVHRYAIWIQERLQR